MASTFRVPSVSPSDRSSLESSSQRYYRSSAQRMNAMLSAASGSPSPAAVPRGDDHIGRYDHHSIKPTSMAAAQASRGHVDLAAIERERWRRATAPLTASDYQRAIDQLNSSTSSSSSSSYPNDAKHEVNDSHAVRYLHMVQPMGDEAAAVLQKSDLDDTNHRVYAVGGGLREASTTPSSGEDESEPIVYRAGVDLLERLLHAEGSLQRAASSGGSSDDDGGDEATGVVYVGVPGGRENCLPLISPLHPAHSHRTKSASPPSRAASATRLVVDEKTHFYNTASAAGASHDTQLQSSPSVSPPNRRAQSSSSHQSQATSDAANDTTDLPWSEQYVRLHEYVTAGPPPTAAPTKVMNTDVSTETMFPNCLRDTGADDAATWNRPLQLSPTIEGVVIRTSSSPARRDASCSPIRRTTPTRQASDLGGDTREGRLPVPAEFPKDDEDAAAEAAARARARQSWEARPRPLPVPSDGDKVQLERWRMRREATEAGEAPVVLPGASIITATATAAAPLGDSAAAGDSPVSDVSEHTQAVIDERARKAREDLDELIQRLCAMDDRETQKQQQQQQQPSRLQGGPRSGSSTPDDIPPHHPISSSHDPRGGGYPPSPVRNGAEFAVSPDDADYYDSLHARREQDMLHRDYLNFSKEAEHETSGIIVPPAVSVPNGGGGTPSSPHPPISTLAQAPASLVNVAADSQAKSGLVQQAAGGQLRVPFWSPTHDTPEQTSGTVASPPTYPNNNKLLNSHDSSIVSADSYSPASPIFVGIGQKSGDHQPPPAATAAPSTIVSALESRDSPPAPPQQLPQQPSSGRGAPATSLATRAKHVDPFTAYEEYIDACSSFSSALQKSRNKMPSESFDSVRSVLGFCLSFAKASHQFIQEQTSLAAGESFDLSGCSTSVEEKDVRPEEPLVMMDQLVSDEVGALMKTLSQKHRQLSSLQSSIGALRVLEANPRLAPEHAVQLPKMDRDIIARRFVLDQILVKGRFAEVQLALLADLYGAYPSAYVSTSAKMLISSVVMRLMDRYAAAIDADSCFTSSFPSGDECVQMDEIGSLRDVVEPACHQRLEAGREQAASIASAIAGAGTAPHGLAKFSFVHGLTSPSHLSSIATSDEAQLVRQLSRSHHECSTIPNRAQEFEQRPKDFSSLDSLLLGAQGDVLAICDEYEDSVKDLCDLVEHRKQLLTIAKQFAELRKQQQEGAPGEVMLLKQLVSEAEALEQQLASNEAYCSKRQQVSKLISAELDLVRRLDQVPLEMPSLVFTHGVSSQQKLLSDQQRRKFSALVTRAQLFVDAVKGNGAVARSLILLVGNCMMKPPAASANAATESAVQTAVAALRDLNLATEVLASSIRREKLLSGGAISESSAEVASPILRDVSAGSLESAGVLSAPKTSSATTVNLFGPNAPTMKRHAADLFVAKTKLLVDPGIMVFSESHPAAGGPSTISRCTMMLDLDSWELRVALVDDHSVAQDGGRLVMQIALQEIEMLTQGGSRPIGATSVQAMKVELISGTAVEVLFPSFASFQEWSEVLFRLVKFKNELHHLRPALQAQ